MGVGWPGQLALASRQRASDAGEERRSDMLVPAEGALEPLTARALVLLPDGEAPLALVRIDAIATTAELNDLVAAAVEDLGYRRETVFVGATHTHSGVGGFMRAPMAVLMGMDNYRPEIEARIAAACAEAIRAAHAAARPAALGFGRAHDRDEEGAVVIARNRRAKRFEPGAIAYDAIDDEIGLLRVDDRESGEPLALLVNYAVHCTVLGSSNLHYSADVAGGIERALSARLGGAPVLFFNGAEGDIAPRRLGSAGGLARCDELGEALADLAAPALADLPVYTDVRVSAVAGDKELGSPTAVMAAGRERFLDAQASWARWLTEPITLPANVVIWTLGLHNIRLAATWNGGLGVVAHLGGLADRTRFRMGGIRLEAGPEDVALLCIPGEATHDVGLAIRAEAARRGATRSFLLGLTLDHVGYIASREEYRRGSYEAWSTLFGERTADEILEGERAVLDALGLDDAPAPTPAPATPIVGGPTPPE